MPLAMAAMPFTQAQGYIQPTVTGVGNQTVWMSNATSAADYTSAKTLLKK